MPPARHTPQVMPPDEATFVHRVQQGDINAFEQLMNIHCRRLRSFVALRLPVPSVVDEIAHETLVHAYHHIGEFNTEGSFAAWLNAIATQLLRSEIQRHARQQTNLQKYLGQRMVECAGKHISERSLHDVDHLLACLERLPDRLRSLVDLRYRLDCSTEELAMRFQQSSAWVRTTLMRVRNQLRACIEQKSAMDSL